MTAPTIDVLDRELDDDLDDAQICECRCAKTDDQHGDNDCDHPAAWYVEIHDFGRCQVAVYTKRPNVTELGFRAVLMCTNCKDQLEKSAEKFLRKLPKPAVCPEFPVAPGCGRPVTRIEDLLPVRRPL